MNFKDFATENARAQAAPHGRHDHEWGDSGFCVHCQKQNPADAADERAGNWLARGNELKEKGKLSDAEKCYEKSANWLMRANDLRGL